MRALNLCAALVAACLLPVQSDAADVNLRLQNVPAEGELVVQFYDAADAFGDLRDPAEERILPARGDGDYELADIPDGSIAVLVYHDENANGRLDKNFIGIPREPLAISNNYQPKGPPTFSRASVEVPPGATVTMELEMYRVLGERGRLGLGVAAITRSSPYVGASGTVVQPIPAITYVGERLQSDFLDGLGDREDTLLAGLGLQYEMGAGLELELLFQYDMLDQIGGGMANAQLSRGFPWRTASFTPYLAYNWLSAEMSNHDFGVPASAATVDRPAYELGSTSSFEAGVGAFVELSEDWRIILSIAVEKLDNDVVDEDTVVKGLAVVTYIF
jgi:outer membrane protein